MSDNQEYQDNAPQRISADGKINIIVEVGYKVPPGFPEPDINKAREVSDKSIDLAKYVARGGA